VAVSFRQAVDYPGDAVAGDIAPAAPAEYRHHPSPADIIRCPLHDAGYTGVTVGRKPLAAVVAAGSIIAEFPEYNLRLELGDSGCELCLEPGEVFLIGYMVGDGDVNVGAVVVVLAAETDVEHISVVLEYVPGAVAVVGVGVQDGEPSRAELFPQAGYG